MGERRIGPGEKERKATARMTTRVHETPEGQSKSSGDEPRRLQERIGKRAYELWLSGGCRHGHDLGDWLQAEREVLDQRAEGPTTGSSSRRSTGSTAAHETAPTGESAAG